MEKLLHGQNDYIISAADGAYDIRADIVSDGGIDTVHLAFESASEIVPPKITLYWEIPHVDVQGIWTPSSGVNRQIPCVWSGHDASSATASAPLSVMFSSSGKSRQTFACSDAVNVIKYRTALREEDSRYLCEIVFFDADIASLRSYSADVRIDMRDVRYEDAISDVVKWWESMPEYTPMGVSDECISPVYSTWYSFHQMVDAEEIEKVLASCEPLGFSSVIVDDGWQMEDSARSYRFCGDWEVCKKKIPDMREHVKRVHDMGMKYFLWYSVPFVGHDSLAYERFKGKYLSDGGDTAIFDPRYSDVREYLISTYETAVKEWDLDGFKLDFIDSFRQPGTENPDAAPGKDFVSVPDAVDRLMTDIKSRLIALKPNICIEFRQAYIGPLMHKYGNMFRAADCANDTLANKVRTIDLRLTLGSSPAHADMLTWNPADTAEAAALQLVSTMFAVPQISVRPYLLPESHNVMMKSWLEFWKAHRSTLLFGKFRAENPELLYSQASAEDDGCYIAVSFANNIIMKYPESDHGETVFVNGSGCDGITVDFPAGEYRAKVESCTGDVLSDSTVKITDNGTLNRFAVPVAGRVTITK